MMLTPKQYAVLLRESLISFIVRSFCDINPQTEFLYSPYIGLLASKLEACARGETKRLIVNLPPRGLKSICVVAKNNHVADVEDRRDDGFADDLLST